jgi:hypothetical protein
MTNKDTVNLSLNSITIGYKLIIYRDRFDLVNVMCKELENSDNVQYDPVKLISLMTWESQPLSEIDCKIVLAHFKNIDNLFKVSKDALEYSINSLKISERSKTGIITFLKSGQDYYIN